jgi:hypothetical protein
VGQLDLSGVVRIFGRQKDQCEPTTIVVVPTNFSKPKQRKKRHSGIQIDHPNHCVQKTHLLLSMWRGPA